MIKQDKIGAKINLIKIPADTPFVFEFDQLTDWVRAFLVELNENATEKTPDAYIDDEDTAIFISGTIEKKNKKDVSEILLVTGKIEVDYVTECVRTLKPMTIQLDVPFKVIFVDESLATTEAFEGIDEYFIENDTYEIYFYKKRVIDFDDMLHEQIFLNYNQYPVLDADSKLEIPESPENPQEV